MGPKSLFFARTALLAAALGAALGAALVPPRAGALEMSVMRSVAAGSADPAGVLPGNRATPGVAARSGALRGDPAGAWLPDLPATGFGPAVESPGDTGAADPASFLPRLALLGGDALNVFGIGLSRIPGLRKGISAVFYSYGPSARYTPGSMPDPGPVPAGLRAAAIQGGGVLAGWRLSDRWSLTGAYGIEDPVPVGPAGLIAAPGGRADPAPRYRISVGSRFQAMGDLEMAVQLHGRSPLADDRGGVPGVDARVGWRSRAGLELSMIGLNLFSDHGGDPMPGDVRILGGGNTRRIYGRVEIRF